MAELSIPATTAADYKQEASRQIHGIRVFENGAVKDDEAAQMQHAVATAAAEVNGDNPPDPPPPSKPAVIELSEQVRVSGPVLFCSADQARASASPVFCIVGSGLPNAGVPSDRPQLVERLALGWLAEKQWEFRDPINRDWREHYNE
jgi:hypothetical protein